MVAKGFGEAAGSGDVVLADLKPCWAQCCTIASCYCVWPDCIGCVNKGECCCFEFDNKACKCLDTETQDGRRAPLPHASVALTALC